MELIKSARRHGTWVSETIYILLNVGLAAAVLLMARLDLFLLAYIFVIVSKWRVLAVRPRYWWDNVQTNLLDMLFGISIVNLMWQAREEFILQIGLALIYAGWLIFIKPLATKGAVMLQALIAQFFAVSALYSISYDLPAWAIVVSMAVIGYITARHALNNFEEADITLLSMIWALVTAEIGWLAYHWTIGYSLIFTNSIFQIPQVAIVVSLISFFSAKIYTLYKEKEKVRLSDFLWPLVFSGATLLVVLTFFNAYQSNI